MIEAVMALAVFMLVTAGASQALLYGARVSAGVMARHELMENARVAMDFLTANISRAEKITLEKRADGTLRKLSLVQTVEGSPHTYLFEYNSSLPPSAVKYHRLEMGGNELASYVGDIRLEIDAEGEVMTIRITSDDRLDPRGDKMTEPVTVAGKVGIRYKTVR